MTTFLGNIAVEGSIPVSDRTPGVTSWLDDSDSDVSDNDDDDDDDDAFLARRD
jgi:hypothetical protein